MSVKVEQQGDSPRYPKRVRRSGNETSFNIFTGPFKKEQRDISGFYPDDPRILVLEADGSKTLVDAVIPGARHWRITDPNLDACIVCNDKSLPNLANCRTCVRSFHWHCLPSPGFHDEESYVYCNICVYRGWHFAPPEDIRPTAVLVFDSPLFVQQNALPIPENDDSSDPPFTPRRKTRSRRSLAVQSSASNNDDDKFEMVTPRRQRKIRKLNSMKSPESKNGNLESYDNPGSARSEKVGEKLPTRLENVFTALRRECVGAIEDRSSVLDSRVKHLEELLEAERDQFNSDKRRIIDENRSETLSMRTRLAEKERILKEQREEIRGLQKRLQESEEVSQQRATEMESWRSCITGMMGLPQ